MRKKHKARPKPRKIVPEILGPQPPQGWISVQTAVPKFGRPVFVTDGRELSHCTRDHADEQGSHYYAVDAPTEEFSAVTHWQEEPLLPNGKRARFPS